MITSEMERYDCLSLANQKDDVKTGNKSITKPTVRLKSMQSSGCNLQSTPNICIISSVYIR